MTDILSSYKIANHQAVDRSFFVNELFDIFDSKYVEHKSRINEMLGNYPKQHLDDLLSHVFSVKKQNFKRIAFELMLHEQLFLLGFVVVVKPVPQQTHAPDFLVTTPAGETFYLEAATVDNDRETVTNSQETQGGNLILDQCETKIQEKRSRYKGQLDKPLVIALNVIDGGLSQTQERDFFFGSDDGVNPQDGIFTKNGRTGVRDDLAGVWYFDRLKFWRLPHTRYCYIPNQYIKPQLLPAEFTAHNLLWMTDKGIEYFSGESFLQAYGSKATSSRAERSAGAISSLGKSSALEELVVCTACIAGFFLMLRYFLF